MQMVRVEKHIIKKSNQYYSMLDDFCFKSKNLYNHANYIIRKEFMENNNYIGYNNLDKLLKADTEFPDYRQMPTAQSAQQLLRLLDSNWKSFFRSIKDYSKNPSKYLGRPKLPKYKSKSGKFVLILTKQEVKLKNNKLKFPKTFNGFTISPHFITNENFSSFQQVRFIPYKNQITVELVYNIEVLDDKLTDNGRYLSIDLGLDNLATITTNIGLKPIIINGKGLKSINKYYNKQISYYRSLAKKLNNSDYTNKMNRLTIKRNNKINDYMHKASKYIIDYAVSNNINTIIIGNNKNWKQNSSMSKLVNQSFIQIPHQRLIDCISYKAEQSRLNIIITEERYTSGTSFLDSELPTKEYYNISRRIKRGLFISNNGIKINADVNGSLQVMKKVFPNVFNNSNTNGIEAVVLQPIRLNIA